LKFIAYLLSCNVKLFEQLNYHSLSLWTKKCNRSNSWWLHLSWIAHMCRSCYSYFV